ncbi:MAG: hypothetical protein ACREJM_00375, partial [Candidatus Saccharimonadales bacterium]
MTLRECLTNVWWTAWLTATLVASSAIAADPLRRSNELPSRLTVAPYHPAPYDAAPYDDAEPGGLLSRGAGPAFSDSFTPRSGTTLGTLAGPALSSPLGASPPPSAICPDTTVESASHGPVQRFIERWSPEGVVPYWGRRTPDWRKDLGIGEPLPSPGWRGQPFSISGFGGATNGGPLIHDRVHEVPSFYGGMNFGWDYDHYWGIEKRLGFGALNLTNGRDQRLQTGLSVTGEYRLMYYPLGDSRWRPFLTTGIGWSDFYFRDDVNHQHLDTLFLFPFGVGLKYLWRERWAFRIDLIDELTMGSHVTSTFHYV